MLAHLSRLFLKGAELAVAHFYEVGLIGGDVPDGPVLVIANHPNSLMDGLVIMKSSGRRVRPLARAPLFEDPLLGHVLKGLGALPVYRPEDFPGETWRNESTFAAAVDALNLGEAVLIFPEGLSHSESRLVRIKTGAARIALEAEEAANWELGLQILPVGLTYQRKHAIRGRVAMSVGEPFGIGAWRWQRERHAWDAVESLTDAMRVALENVTLNLPSPEDRALIDAADALYAAEKGWVRPRARERLAPRMPRLRRFAEALAWLHVAEPESYERLTSSVRDYRQRLALLGVTEGELPDHLRPHSVLKYALVQGFALLVKLPLAVLGTVVWYLPYKSPRISLGLYNPPYEVVATFKLGTALLVFPVVFVAYLVAAWWLAGLPGVVVTAIVLPISGVVALSWRDRWRRVREDLRIIWRSTRQRSLRDQLVGRRGALVSEFEFVAQRWQKERQARAEG